MNVGEKYLDFATGAEEVSELYLSYSVSIRFAYSVLSNAYHGHEVGAVRSVMSEIGISWASFGVPTGQWSQCLGKSTIAAN